MNTQRLSDEKKGLTLLSVQVPEGANDPKSFRQMNIQNPDGSIDAVIVMKLYSDRVATMLAELDLVAEYAINGTYKLVEGGFPLADISAMYVDYIDQLDAEKGGGS